ncbi:hypothetical protein [Coleofasciculus sp. H7-2]|uniref:hypothetical protein n=1 Tax=Coleofasciculus sp. H7-2 TaxID=3351545 RepID=UPI003672DC7C
MLNQVTSQSLSLGADSVTVINIDATTNNKENSVVQFLTAGTYEVRVVGTSEGGRYDAWSLWNFTTGCDEKGENCITGWVNEYNIMSSEFTINIPSSGKYSTAEQALALAQNTSFTLTSDANVNFFIGDDILPDNRGGVSLAVKKVREASAYPQLKTGSLVLILIVLLTVGVIWLLINLITSNATSS